MKKLITAVVALILCGVAIADWEYTLDKNPMTDEVYNTYARVENPNFPYGSILVATRKKTGTEIRFHFRSHIDCPMLSCVLLVRFDDDPPLWIKVKQYSDQFPYEVTMVDPNQFIQPARKAKRIRLQAKFKKMHESFNIDWWGEQVMEFKTPQPLEMQPLVGGVRLSPKPQ